MKLRDYQSKANAAILQEWNDGRRSTLVVLPTGTGKTILFASIIQSLQPARAMVLAHREELIWQARDKIQSVTGMKADVEMGSYKATMETDMFHPRSSVIVSTIQTHVAGGDGGGRMTKFDPNDFGVLIVDEAHHATSSTYRRTIDYYLQNPKLVVLGVTATPDRADEEALGQVFESVAYDYEILDAIRDGWLVPIEQQMVSVDGLDFSGMRTTAGDLNGADLAEVMESEKNLHGIAGATIEIAGSRRGIGFAASVEQARRLSEIFNRHRAGMSNWVCGKTDKDERKQIISDFAAGRVQFLWNCGVFTEGFDDSGVEIIAMGRPTKSRALYGQMAGRATRPHESIAHRLNGLPVAALRRGMIARSVKPSCTILDFAGNSGRHKLMTTADILGGNYSEEIVQAATETARKAGKPVRMAEVLEDEEKRAEEKKKRELEEAARKAKLVAKTSFKTQKIDPFDAYQIKPVAARGWDKGRTLSEGQKGVLRKMGLDPADYEYHQAKQILDKQFEIWKKAKEGGYHACTLKMINRLKKYNIDATGMSIEKGKACLDAIAKNNWQLPKNFVVPGSVKIPPRPAPSAPEAFQDDTPF